MKMQKIVRKYTKCFIVGCLIASFGYAFFYGINFDKYSNLRYVHVDTPKQFQSAFQRVVELNQNYYKGNEHTGTDIYIVEEHHEGM